MDSSAYVGAYASIAIDSKNKLHISYYGEYSLRYATNASGTWVITTIDSGGVGLYTAIAIDSKDKVHIIYSDFTNGYLKYATNVSGTWVNKVVDTGEDSVMYYCLAVDSSSKAHISYFDVNTGDIKYATNASGNWIRSVIDTIFYGFGTNTAIAIDSQDKAHISYYDNWNHDLKYATNASGSWVTITADGNGAVGQYSSIAVDHNDKVHISYYDNSSVPVSRDLRYCTNAVRPTPTATPTLTPTPTPTETPLPTPTPLIHYTFDSGEEGWQFAGKIALFYMPQSNTGAGKLGLSPAGSTNCFSYWYSQGIQLLPFKTDENLYRARWFIGSSVTNPDSAVQFRLRVNQIGAWSAWDRVVNSYLNNAPSSETPKVYLVFFNPRITGSEDNQVIFSFDIASFALEDDVNSWLWLEELLVEEISLVNTTEILRYDFTSDAEGWAFQNIIPPFDPAISGMAPGVIGLSLNGSLNYFSYWVSPDVLIENAKTYRLVWQVGCSTGNPDATVQFRLRVNQKGAWSSWNRIVNS